MLRLVVASVARLSIFVVLSGAILLPQSTFSAPPLDSQEAARAEALATALPWRSLRARGTATSHPLGVQNVVVEQESRKGAAGGLRLARVYQYDHRLAAARRVRVDLTSGTTLDGIPVRGHHLPLNAAERQWALSRLAADRPLLDRMRSEQRRLGRPAFDTLDELDLKASVFVPTDPSHPCAHERCALLALFDASRTVFAVEPVVRFGSGAVSTVTALELPSDAR